MDRPELKIAAAEENHFVAVVRDVIERVARVNNERRMLCDLPIRKGIMIRQDDGNVVILQGIFG